MFHTINISPKSHIDLFSDDDTLGTIGSISIWKKYEWNLWLKVLIWNIRVDFEI